MITWDLLFPISLPADIGWLRRLVNELKRGGVAFLPHYASPQEFAVPYAAKVDVFR